MEAALDVLRSRFLNEVVIAFEKLWDVRPEREPYIDLGPAKSTLEQVLGRIRRDNPRYEVELLSGGLVHIYPAYDTADPAGLLNLRLREFFLPPDDCMAQQLLIMDGYGYFSYAPELSTYLWEHKLAWYRAHGKEPSGVIGDFLGDCEPANHRQKPIYHNITVRDALNLMAVRSLQVARASCLPTAPTWVSTSQSPGSTAVGMTLLLTLASEECPSCRCSSVLVNSCSRFAVSLQHRLLREQGACSNVYIQVTDGGWWIFPLSAKLWFPKAVFKPGHNKRGTAAVDQGRQTSGEDDLDSLSSFPLERGATGRDPAGLQSWLFVETVGAASTH